MVRSQIKAQSWAAVLVSVVLLTSCGGGGNSVDDPGSGGGGTASASGLLPAAPSAGEVLVDDSSSLRPLVADGLWIYRQFVANVGPLEPRVTQAAIAGGRLLESSTDGADAAIEVWREADGSTSAAVEIPLAPGATLTVTGPELPRTLRADQQITVDDRRIDNVGADLDGDGANDGLDMAVWRRIVGFENLRIPASPQTVRALRIDDRVALRARLTGGGAAEIVESSGSSWYAEGIGVVRSVSWTDIDGTVADSDTRLVGFDGGTRGYGIVQFREGAQPGTQIVPHPDGVITLNQGYGDGYILTLDRNGQVVASADPPARAGESPSWRQLLPTSAGLRLASRNAGGPNDAFNIDALNSSGQLVGDRLGTLRIDALDSFVNSNGEASLLSHPASDVLWMLFVDTRATGPGNRRDALIVRRFDASAQSLGDALRYEPPNSTSVGVLHALATPDGITVIIEQFDPMATSGTPVRVLSIRNSGSVEFNREFHLGASTPSIVWTLADDAANRWLLWMPSLPGAVDPPEPHGIRIGADGSPIGTPDEPSAIASSVLLSVPASLHAAWRPQGVMAIDGEWWMVGSEIGSLNDGASEPREHPILARLMPGSGAPADGLIVEKWPFSSGGSSTTAPVAFDDRLLFWVGGLPVVAWR